MKMEVKRSRPNHHKRSEDSDTLSPLTTTNICVPNAYFIQNSISGDKIK